MFATANRSVVRTQLRMKSCRAGSGPVHPGYGAMTQKYAEEFGQFFQLPLR